MREKISACIMTFNEERKIQACLESIRWCDEIVVLDSFSTDRTEEICRRFTDRFFQQEWLGYVGQRNTIRGMATHEWVLFLDADEVVTPELRDEILAEFESGANADIAGYDFPRMVQYLGRWIRHGEWYPDRKLRLFRRSHGRSEGVEPHDKVAVNGRVKHLAHPVMHFTYDDVRDHLETLNRFSSISAQQKFIQQQPFHWGDVLFRPSLRFLKGYFLKRGFLDGFPGLIIATLSAYATFAKYVKLWELWREQKEGPAGPP